MSKKARTPPERISKRSKVPPPSFPLDPSEQMEIEPVKPATKQEPRKRTGNLGVAFSTGRVFGEISLAVSASLDLKEDQRRIFQQQERTGTVYIEDSKWNHATITRGGRVTGKFDHFQQLLDHAVIIRYKLTFPLVPGEATLTNDPSFGNTKIFRDKVSDILYAKYSQFKFVSVDIDTVGKHKILTLILSDEALEGNIRPKQPWNPPKPKEIAKTDAPPARAPSPIRASSPRPRATPDGSPTRSRGSPSQSRGSISDSD